MVRLLYNVFFYLALLLVVPFVGFKALTDGRYRYRLLDRLGFSPFKRNKPVIWCHVASVGEVLLAIPFFRQLLTVFPDYDLFVSTQTPSGHQTITEKMGNQVTAFLIPVDSYDAVRRAISRTRPALFIVFETELWPNLLLGLKHRKVALMMLNGRISDASSRRYRLVRFGLGPVLRAFDCLCMQSQADAKRIELLGAPVERIVVTGNLKYDRTLPPCQEDLKDMVDTILSDHGKRPLLVLGSLHHDEFDLVSDTIQEVTQHTPLLRFIAAPRHIEHLGQLEACLRNRGFKIIRRSERKNAPVSRTVVGMVLDTYGELSSVYSLATIVFVGGSLCRHGGQNMLEPVYFRKPVLFGPHVWNFREISDHLLEHEAAIMVSDGPDLVRKINHLLDHEDVGLALGERGYQVISLHRGATDKAVNVVRDILSRHGNDSAGQL